MARQVTSEERNILLSHPEFVMFDPYMLKLGKPMLALSFLPLLFCPFAFALIAVSGLVKVHPHIAGFLMAMSMVFACIVLIFLYIRIDDWYDAKYRNTHYSKHLHILLPKDLKCDVVHVTSVVREKAEGWYIKDGEEKMFGFSRMVNYIKIEPDSDLVEIYDGKGFWALVARDDLTESLYKREQV
jgi:hypothetical protein